MTLCLVKEIFGGFSDSFFYVDKFPTPNALLVCGCQTSKYELVIANTHTLTQEQLSIPCLWFAMHCQVVSRGRFWLEHGLLYFLLHDQVLRRLWLQVSGLLCHEQYLAPEKAHVHVHAITTTISLVTSGQDIHFKRHFSI